MEDPEDITESADALAALGAELRREREVRDIPLQEIADHTKVSARFLEAIEAGDHTNLPAPVFTRGFIHEYASFLGLDAETTVDRYVAHVRHDREIEDREEGLEPIPMLPAAIWIRIAVVVGILLVLGVVAYFMFRPMVEGGDSDPVAIEESSETGENETTDEEEPVDAPEEENGDSEEASVGE